MKLIFSNRERQNPVLQESAKYEYSIPFLRKAESSDQDSNVFSWRHLTSRNEVVIEKRLHPRLQDREETTQNYLEESVGMNFDMDVFNRGGKYLVEGLVITSQKQATDDVSQLSVTQYDSLSDQTQRIRTSEATGGPFPFSSLQFERSWIIEFNSLKQLPSESFNKLNFAFTVMKSNESAITMTLPTLEISRQLPGEPRVREMTIRRPSLINFSSSTCSSSAAPSMEILDSNSRRLSTIVPFLNGADRVLGAIKAHAVERRRSSIAKLNAHQRRKSVQMSVDDAKKKSLQSKGSSFFPTAYANLNKSSPKSTAAINISSSDTYPHMPLFILPRNFRRISQLVTGSEAFANIRILENHRDLRGIFGGLESSIENNLDDFKSWRNALLSLRGTISSDGFNRYSNSQLLDLLESILPPVACDDSDRESTSGDDVAVEKSDKEGTISLLCRGCELTILQTLVLAEALFPNSARYILDAVFGYVYSYLAEDGHIICHDDEEIVDTVWNNPIDLDEKEGSGDFENTDEGMDRFEWNTATKNHNKSENYSVDSVPERRSTFLRNFLDAVVEEEEGEDEAKRPLLSDPAVNSTNCWSKLVANLRSKVHQGFMANKGSRLKKIQTYMLTCRDFENWEEALFGYFWLHFFNYSMHSFISELILGILKEISTIRETESFLTSSTLKRVIAAHDRYCTVFLTPYSAGNQLIKLPESAQ